MTKPRACRGCKHAEHEQRCEVMVEHNTEPGKLSYWAQCDCTRRKKPTRTLQEAIAQARGADEPPTPLRTYA